MLRRIGRSCVDARRRCGGPGARLNPGLAFLLLIVRWIVVDCGQGTACPICCLRSEQSLAGRGVAAHDGLLLLLAVYHARQEVWDPLVRMQVLMV